MLDNKKNVTATEGSANHYLDITRETCPMTFVRAKLMLEKMYPGETIEIRLKGQEPLSNLPRSIKEIGHEVLELAVEDDGHDPAGVHRMIVKKK